MSENIWFTSDTHFFHKTILWIGDGRPFSTVEEMNEAMIERWNECVKPTDRIYHLGDFSFGNKTQTRWVLDQLQGQKFFLRGNHDSVMRSGMDHYFEEMYDYKRLKVEDQTLILFHYPIESWHNVGHGAWHLHGHCHGNLADTPMARMDVGVDTNNFFPWAFEDIADRMRGRTGMPSDHHQEKR